jgi:hypothetical protein
MDQVLAQAKVKVSATSSTWEPQRAYERRLTNIMSKTKGYPRKQPRSLARLTPHSQVVHPSFVPGLPASRGNLLRVTKSQAVNQARTQHRMNPRPSAHNPALHIAPGGRARSQTQHPPARMEKAGQRLRDCLQVTTRSVRRPGYARLCLVAGLEANGRERDRRTPRRPHLAQKGKSLQRLPGSVRELLSGTRQKKKPPKVKKEMGMGMERKDKARPDKKRSRANGEHPPALLDLWLLEAVLPVLPGNSTCAGNALVTD